jgi:hypothetical protein
VLPQVLINVAFSRVWLIDLLLIQNVVDLLILLHECHEFLPLSDLHLKVILWNEVHLIFGLLLHDVEQVYHVDKLLQLANLLLVMLVVSYCLWVQRIVPKELGL